MDSCVVLLSGGLDSATVSAIAKADGYRLFALSVDYGQRHAIELDSARKVAAAFGVSEHRVVSVDLRSIGGSALTDNIQVPKDNEAGPGIPITYVPARNTVMLALALGYAEVIGAQHIFIGVNAIDYSGYPDCRPEFIEEFGRLARVATKAGIEGRALRIHAPLITMTKAEIIQKGVSLGVDYSITHSCYDPNSSGEACGHCDSCLIRKAAFESLGLTDPVLCPSRS